MRYFYINCNDNISIGNVDNHYEIGTKISKEQFDYLNNGIKNNQLIYCDKENNLKLRNKFTRWDESMQIWVPDENAINEHQKQIFKSQAQAELDRTKDYESESYKAVCTDEENAANLAYRIELRKILKDMYNGTELPINPNKKE